MSAVLTSALPQTLPESLRAFSHGPQSDRGAIQKVSYTHDAMIDLIISDPWITQRRIADHFGYTEGWVCQVFAADAFQSRLAERKNELVDPAIKATVEERFKGLLLHSLEVLRRKLEQPTIEAETALKAVDIASKALGYGAKVQQNNNVQFVVHVPGKSATAEAWAEAHNPALGPGAALQKAARPSNVEDAVVVPAPVLAPSGPLALDTKEVLDALRGLSA